MEEMVKMNSRSGKVIDENLSPQPIKMPSRKEMRATMLPKVGDLVEGFKVIYVNNGKFRFTASGQVLPIMGHRFIDTGRIWEVEMLQPEKSRFSAVFKGFHENPIAQEAPVEIEDDLVKVI